MLKQRIITAIILAVSIIASVIFLNTSHLAYVLGAIICIGAWEWTACAGLTSQLQKVMYMVAFIFIQYICLELLPDAWLEIIIYLSLAWWLLVIYLIVRYQKQQFISLSSRFLKAIIGIVILIPAWLSLIFMHTKDSGVSLILLLFMLIWFADSSAYFSGKKYGKNKLANHVSPGKSWEGVYGALCVSFLIGLIYAFYDDLDTLSSIYMVFLLLLTVVFSIVGDLAESMFKRMAGVKDSSQILPGHGGVLDRIDSLTAAAPVFLIGLWSMEKFL